MPKTLGIAFGGSGAQAIAGIAYIKALENLEIKPDVVSGTGIGAVVAAMYAAGMVSEDMIGFLREIVFPGSKRPINAAKVKDLKGGILDGLGLEEYYKMAVPIKVFDRLYFPLKIVAANTATGEEVLFTQGDVGPAVRSAAAVPGIFSPHEVAGEFYMDGSCVNPVPFDVIRDECDILAAIDPDITEEAQADSAQVFSVLMNAFRICKKALLYEKQRVCTVDLYEHIVLDGFTIFDFAHFEAIIESAEEQAGVFALGLQDLLK